MPEAGPELVGEVDSPARRGPILRGQPPWIMKPAITRWKRSPS